MLGNSLAIGSIYPSGGAVSFTGFLNTYPGATAAYSLRKLDKDYTGPAIRVRRSSDNAESDIGFTASGDLDEAALLAHVGPGDGFVTKWYDQSSTNLYDAPQTSASAQPKIVDSGTVITQGGKPAIEFDGLNDYLFEGSNDFNRTEGHVLFVAKADTTSRMGIVGGYIDTTTIGINNSYFSGAASSTNNGSASNHNTDYNLVSVLKSPPDAFTFRVNGADDTGGSNSGYRGANKLIIGAAYNGTPSLYYNGKIQEILIYPNDQTANQSGMESNINTYYEVY